MHLPLFLKRYWWAFGLLLALSYLIFEGLVQNGLLSLDMFSPKK